MIAERNFKRLFEELRSSEGAEITLNGMPISIRVFDQGSKLSLATSVYEGGNYIPQGVRHCLNQKAPFKPSSIQTYLNVDEPNYRISLNYLGHLAHFNSQQFCSLIEEFNWLAEEWRLFLDEHDRNDLVHVRVSK